MAPPTTTTYKRQPYYTHLLLWVPIICAVEGTVSSSGHFAYNNNFNAELVLEPINFTSAQGKREHTFIFCGNWKVS